MILSILAIILGIPIPITITIIVTLAIVDAITVLVGITSVNTAVAIAVSRHSIILAVSITNIAPHNLQATAQAKSKIHNQIQMMKYLYIDKTTIAFPNLPQINISWMFNIRKSPKV